MELKLYVKNNICCLQGDEGLQLKSFISNYLTTYELVKSKIYTKRGNQSSKFIKEPVALYTMVNSNNIKSYIFPRGLYDLIPDEIKSNIYIVDESTHDYDIKGLTSDRIKTSLQPESGFDLREDQVMSVMKSLMLKRGVVQLPTGSGKTEVISSIIKILETTYPDIKILVIEPTDILVTNTTKRFNKYNLDANVYKSDHDLSHAVTVSHPVSLLNDIKSGKLDLKSVNAVFWDEAQHCKCDTWKELNNALMNVEYAIGLSALAINEKHLYESSVNRLSVDESQIIGSTGKVIMYLTAKYYIDRGILATPVIIQLNNRLKDLEKEDNWHNLRKNGIQSEDRTKLTSKVSNMFLQYGRRVLVLVGTKQQAYDIATDIVETYGYSDRLGISFGGAESYTIDPDKLKKVSYKGSIIDAFDDGKLDILISTNHLDEGVDISNLDVAILASGGKKDRRIIQRIGRALRRTKTGKYAYVVDFSDNGNGILNYHSNLRMKLYKDLIEVPKDLIMENISLEDAEERFKKLEDIHE